MTANVTCGSSLTQLLTAQLQAGDQQRQSLASNNGVFDGDALLPDANARVQRGWRRLSLAAGAAIASCEDQTLLLLL